LDRTPESDEQWGDLLGSPEIGRNFFERPVAVSVGLQDDAPKQTEVQEFKIIRIHPIRFWICAFLLALIIYLILTLARRSALLRDGDRGTKYSLARCQMAFWFVLTIGSFLFIWLITGAVDIINGTDLALLGIGAGTALGATAIDRSRQATAKLKLEDSKALKQRLSVEIGGLSEQIQSMEASQARRDLEKQHALMQHELEAANERDRLLERAAAPQPSTSFLTDILSDREGIEFHRFQMVVWTVGLGLIFITSVWSRLSMPEFNATLLTLMGISSGTYLGFKIPEPGPNA
jgi:hypothetical protein